MAKSLVSVPKKKEREDFISSMIKGEMVRYHKSPEQIAVKAQFSTKTLTTKLGEPGRFLSVVVFSSNPFQEQLSQRYPLQPLL